MAASTSTFTPVKTSATALHHYAGLNRARRDGRIVAVLGLLERP